MLSGEDYYMSQADAEADCFNGFFESSSAKKKSSQIKKRFSDEQIKSLETLFESESKLEPRKKLQLARELGLQPRQVAIWFQNKRARWKSKQLERDYNVLRASYDALASQFESLKKDKQSLVVQLNKLHDLLEKTETGEGDSQCCGQEPTGINSDDHSDNVTNSAVEVKLSCSLSFGGSEQGLGVLSDEVSSIKAEYFGLKEEQDHHLVNVVEPVDGCLTSPENWEGLGPTGFLERSNADDSYQWWDFWS